MLLALTITVLFILAGGQPAFADGEESVATVSGISGGYATLTDARNMSRRLALAETLKASDRVSAPRGVTVTLIDQDCKILMLRGATNWTGARKAPPSPPRTFFAAAAMMLQKNERVAASAAASRGGLAPPRLLPLCAEFVAAEGGCRGMIFWTEKWPAVPHLRLIFRNEDFHLVGAASLTNRQELANVGGVRFCRAAVFIAATDVKGAVNVEIGDERSGGLGNSAPLRWKDVWVENAAPLPSEAADREHADFLMATATVLEAQGRTAAALDLYLKLAEPPATVADAKVALARYFGEKELGDLSDFYLKQSKKSAGESP